MSLSNTDTPYLRRDSEPPVAHTVLQALTALLGDLSGVEFALDRAEVFIPNTMPTVDAILRLEIKDDLPWKLIAEVKYSSDTNALYAGFHHLEQCRNFLVAHLPKSESARTIPLLIVPYLSPQAITRCAERGIACADSVGNGRIIAGNLLVEREGRPDPRPRRDPALRTLYSPRAERVLRVLLQSTGAENWLTQQLSNTAQVSIGEVSKVRQALREREAIIESGRFSGFRLAHPDALLADWAAHFRSRKTVGQVHRYHTLASAEEVITALTKRQADADGDAAQVGSNSRTDIALSGLTAAEQYASYTRTPRTTAYVRPEALPDIEAYLDLEPVTSGANVILTTPYDDGVFLPPATITGVPIVSEVQTYLDLQRLGGRAEEAAQFLLEKVLRPHWKVEEVD